MIDKTVVAGFTEEYLRGSSNYVTDVTVTNDNLITVEIDNDKGVNIDDCVALSRFLEEKLNRDVEDFELTVTSAGITSPFKTLRQYRKYIGEEVEVLGKKGEKRTGLLKSADENGFVVTVSKMVKPEGAKRKTAIEEDIHFAFEEIKYTKYHIRFK